MIWGVRFQTADSIKELKAYMGRFYNQKEIEKAQIVPYKTGNRTKYVLLERPPS
jgi:hypothetical protein